MLKFIIKIFTLCVFTVSCNVSNPKFNFLVTSNYLEDIDSIKTQTPYRVLNVGHGYRLSNLPTKLRNMRDSQIKQYDAWDEIQEDYQVESTVHIDTISNSEIRISRGVYKWIYENDKRVQKRISFEEFKQLLNAQGIDLKNIEVLSQKEYEWSGGAKSTFIEIRYKGTINEIRLDEKGIVNIDTYLISQIPYWESQGHQFSTTTPETIEKYTHKRGN
jgi:hypothetical protein